MTPSTSGVGGFVAARWQRNSLTELGVRSDSPQTAEVTAISPRCAQKGYPHEDIHLVLRGYDKQALRLLDIQGVLVPVDIAQLRRNAQAARPLLDSAFDHDSMVVSHDPGRKNSLYVASGGLRLKIETSSKCLIPLMTRGAYPTPA
jgi:hypothetical protein